MGCKCWCKRLGAKALDVTHQNYRNVDIEAHPSTLKLGFWGVFCTWL